MCHNVNAQFNISNRCGDASYLMDHYVTQYNSSYGPHWSAFKPQEFSLKGSGYVSNNRPVIQYNSYLDEQDNPKFGSFSNLASVTHSDFSNPNWMPPNKGLPVSSKIIVPKKYDTGGIKDNGHIIHSVAENSINSMLPVKNPLALTDPKFAHSNEKDNMYATTYQTNFMEPVQTNRDLSEENFKAKFETGSTRNNPGLNTITGRRNPGLTGTTRPWQTDRPTGTTTYNEEYKSRPIKKDLNVEQVIVPQPRNLHDIQPYGKQEPKFESSKVKMPSIFNGTTEPSGLNNTTIGNDSSSGYTRNESTNNMFDGVLPDQFVTTYQTQFYHPPPGMDRGDRQGHVHFNTQPTKISIRAEEAQINKHVQPRLGTSKLC